MAPVVLDADLVIGHLDSTDAHHARSHSLLSELAEAGNALAMSTLTLAEVMVGPMLADREDEVGLALARLEIEEVALGSGSALRLSKLRARSGLRLPDCCVLLAAEDLGASAIATFDRRLAKVATGRSLHVYGI